MDQFTFFRLIAMQTSAFYEGYSAIVRAQQKLSEVEIRNEAAEAAAKFQIELFEGRSNG